VRAFKYIFPRCEKTFSLSGERKNSPVEMRGFDEFESWGVEKLKMKKSANIHELRYCLRKKQ